MVSTFLPLFLLGSNRGKSRWMWMTCTLDICPKYSSSFSQKPTISNHSKYGLSTAHLKTCSKDFRSRSNTFLSMASSMTMTVTGMKTSSIRASTLEAVRRRKSNLKKRWAGTSHSPSKAKPQVAAWKNFFLRIATAKTTWETRTFSRAL